MIENSDKFFLNSIIFDENLSNDMINIYKNNYIYVDKILLLLKNFVITCNDMQMMDEYMQHKIYLIINYIRNNYKCINQKEKVDKYNLYNEIIVNLNNSNQINSEIFYILEFRNRGMNYDYKFKSNEYKLPEHIKNYIRKSLYCDKYYFDVLSKNEKNISDIRCFDLVMNPLFIYSVNNFLLECPKILEQNSLLKKILIYNIKNSNIFIYKQKGIKISSKKLLKEIRW